MARGEKDITVATGNFDRFYLNRNGENDPNEWKKLEQLGNPEIIDAFRWTAQILDEITYDIVGGGGQYDPTTSDYYRGLIELKRIANKRGLVITTDTAYDDMNEAEKYFDSIFNPMHASFTKEILTDDSDQSL